MADDLYIGLMSGTSLDGIDAVLVSFENEHVSVVESICSPLSSNIKDEIKSLISPTTNEINRLMALDVQLGKIFAEVVNQLINKANIKNTQFAFPTGLKAENLINCINIESAILPDGMKEEIVTLSKKSTQVVK